MNYVKTICGQKFIDHPGPNIFSLLDFDVKQKFLYYKNKSKKIE